MTLRGPRPAARILCALAFALLLSAEVRAQAPGAAEVLFRDAVALAKQGKYADAVAKFQASYELDPARGTLLGWALAEERAGKVASSLAHYQQLREEARRAGDSEREAQATRAIAKLVGRVPMLTIATARPLPEGTTLTLSGRTLPRGALDTQLPLDPGEYVLVAEAPGGARFERRIALREAARERVEIDLPPPSAAPPPGPEREKPPSPPPPPPGPAAGGGSALRISGLVVGAVGLAGLGVGAYLWLDSGARFDQVSSACPGNACPPDQRSAIDRGRNEEAIGRVALILGGVATAVGVTLFVVGSSGSSPSEKTVALTAAPGAVRLWGRF